MEQEKYCSKCKRPLSKQNPGLLCIICQDKIAQSQDEEPYYDVTDMMHILGLYNEESVRRLSRAGKIPGRIPGIKQHLFSKTAIDHWIESDHIYPQISPAPVSPLQEEAYKLCQQGDHSWMGEERFQGQACTVVNSAEVVGNAVKMTAIYRCYFCQHEETHKAIV